MLDHAILPHVLPRNNVPVRRPTLLVLALPRLILVPPPLMPAVRASADEDLDPQILVFQSPLAGVSAPQTPIAPRASLGDSISTSVPVPFGLPRMVAEQALASCYLPIQEVAVRIGQVKFHANSIAAVERVIKSHPRARKAVQKNTRHSAGFWHLSGGLEPRARKKETPKEEFVSESTQKIAPIIRSGAKKRHSGGQMEKIRKYWRARQLSVRIHPYQFHFCYSNRGANHRVSTAITKCMYVREGCGEARAALSSLHEGARAA